MHNNTPPLISIVSPVYKAETIVEELVKQIKAALTNITANYEIILVNDYSPDGSWEQIKVEASKDPRVKGIHFSKNYGQHYAITAGLDYAVGQWMVVMDCDLQDRPDEIPNLYKKALEGWDIVHAKRMNRQDKWSKRVLSQLFYKAYNYFSGLAFDGSIANFGIYHSKVINEFKKLNEASRSFPSLVQHLGFESCAIEVKHSERFDGETAYTYAKLISLAMDVIIANSNKPLRLIISIGFIISSFAFLFAAYNLVAYFTGFIQMAGFTTIVFSIWFIGGLILGTLGIIGLYIGSIFNEVKNRPLYIVSKVLNTEKKDTRF